METATISHTKNHLSALLQRVRKGETIVILDRDEPVAHLVPIPPPVEVDEEEARMQRLEAAGIIKRPKHRGPYVLPPPILAKSGASLLAALLADREEGW